MRLNIPETYYSDKLSHNQILKIKKIIVLGYQILKINHDSLPEKMRLNYILRSYSLSNQNINAILIKKYIQKFSYEYIKHHKLNTSQKKQNILIKVALTYIYTIYKLLKSQHPLFIYCYLIQNNKTL